MQILLIERGDVRGLWPFSATHCAWELRTGLFTTLERWQRAARQVPVCVASRRPLVEALFRERYGSTTPQMLPGPTLVVEAQAIISSTEIERLVDACSASSSDMLIHNGNRVIGAYVTLAANTHDAIEDAFDGLSAELPVVSVESFDIEYLWQVFDILPAIIADDARRCATPIHPHAVVHPLAVIDETHGPVIIDEGATIQPFAVIHGPAAIGKHVLVKSHATLRNVVLGPVCKVAGELDTVVMQGFGSKQHDGFVGHSYLCEWTNLGAGTTTSNLLNTYGSIIVHAPWGRQQTNRIFLGVLMGEHTKTAIGTMLMTGTYAGVCANIVSPEYPPSFVPSFMWKDPQTHRATLTKSLTTAATVMQRRGQTPGPAMINLLTAIHEHGDV